MNITSRYRMKELYDYYEDKMERCPFMQVVEGSSDGTVTPGEEKIMIGQITILINQPS